MSDSARDLFLRALEREDPEGRRRFVAEQTADAPDLRGRVNALLDAHDADDSFLERPAEIPASAADGATVLTEPTADDEPGPARSGPGEGSVVGPYKLLQRLGEGGMGTVYLAEQTEPVVRRVAVKLIKPGLAGPEAVARFEAERQALALMDHPNIARVLDAGATDAGSPYFVMELVRGVPITDYCDANRLPPRDRLGLFAAVCRAVQHAHTKGVIHRDVKPSNVLVAPHDGVPVPKVIDFGVAKATAQRLTERTLFTRHGQIVGTLEYMSPEQAELNQLDVDTRSDVYSLGVLLYELLTGTTPITKEQLREAGFAEMLRLIREGEAPRPSLRLSGSGEALPGLSAQRRTDPAKLPGLLRGEVDWIVMKALEKDRSRRYQTAAALADDVGRYLADESVDARPPTAAYRFGKFARRHRGPLIAATAVAAALLVGLGASVWQAVRATRAEGAAARRAADAVAARTEADAARREAEAAGAAEAAERKTAEVALLTARRSDYFNTIALAERYWQAADLGRAEQLLAAADPEFRNWEWGYLKRLSNAAAVTFTGDNPAFSPDGATLAVVQKTGEPGVERVALFDAETWEEAGRVEPGAGAIYDIAFGPGGDRLALLCEDEPGRPAGARPGTRWVVPLSLRVVAVEGGAELARAPVGDNRPAELAWTPNGAAVAVATTVSNPVQGGFMPDRLVLFDAATGETRWAVDDFGEEVAVHPDGGVIVAEQAVRRRLLGQAGLDDTFLALLDPATGEHRNPVNAWNPTNRVRYEVRPADLAYAPSGRWLAAAGRRGVRLCDGRVDPDAGAHPTEAAETLTVPDLRPTAVAFTADLDPDPEDLTERLVVGYKDGTVRVWDVAGRSVIRTIRAHPGGIAAVAVRPGGRTIVTGGTDGTVRVWPNGPDADQRWRAVPTPDGTHNLALDPDRGRVAAETWSANVLPFFPRQAVRVGPTDGGEPRRLAAFNSAQSRLGNPLAFAPEGGRLAGEVGGNAVAVWDPDTGETVAALRGHTDKLGAIAFAPGGDRLATATKTEVRLWVLPGGEPAGVFPTEAGATGTDAAGADGRETLLVNALAFSPDGARLAVCGTGAASGDLVQPGRVELWDAATGEVLNVWPAAHESPAAGVAFSPDGRTLATAGWDETAALWSLDPANPGRPLRRLRGHRSSVRGVAFTPDGRRLASTSFDRVKLWDVRSGREVLSVDLPERANRTRPVFDAAGHTLAVEAQYTGLLLDAAPWDGPAE